MPTVPGARACSDRRWPGSCRTASAASVARPDPGSPTTTVPRPVATAAVAAPTADRHAADTHGSPSSPAGPPPSTRKTSPRGAGRTSRPLLRAAISALVALAAVCARPSSS